ncbi:Transmembrane protein 163 [Sciurus carolinensis]|uniref:Transmembrane protein 163 n=1 Tax=Sciurus carolinensis TaxID=30640 RepID=A0AA41NGR8_SCICA|nr:Transmembrane protein 163 [Sciurus carolinensis]
MKVVKGSGLPAALPKDDFLFSVSILSGILCSILAVLKFMLGKVLTSRALITDGFNSLVGGVMGFSILLSAEVFKHNAAVWYLDGSIGVLIGLTIFAYGVNKHQVFTECPIPWTLVITGFRRDITQEHLSVAQL